MVFVLKNKYKERMSSSPPPSFKSAFSPFDHMQAALNLGPKSPHSTNKVAATLFGRTKEGQEYIVSRTNYWPDAIFEKFGTETEIGNSSGTIHAETACILANEYATENGSICVTDPFCPNCAKNIAEAGIKNIYIDEDGFDKDFFKRRGDDFDRMSMQICQRAGINVYALNMVTRQSRTILEIPDDYIPVEDSPMMAEPIETINEANLQDIIDTATQQNKRRKFAIAFAKSRNGNNFALTARAHAVIGYSMRQPEEAIDLLTPRGKYSFIQEPVNRLMMYMARKGFTLYDDYLYCSQVPTSREQVNLIGADIKRITIGDTQKCRDSSGFDAMQQLKEAGILDYS